MSDFEKQIHNMFDHIWDCDINHPIFDDTVGELMNAVIQCYNNLPSAEPERKKGKWIYVQEEHKYMCSSCHARIDKFDKFRSFFCYHCGADMRGESE